MLRGSIHFRTLDQELLHENRTQQGGFHDLIAPAIHFGVSNSAMVSKHEGFHDELLKHSPFGGFQSDVAFFASEALNSTAEYALLQRWRDLSIMASRMAHETYATYLSIKWFSPDHHDRLLERHPEIYRGYYTNLANVVDEHFQSSFIQFIVGKTIGACAFWSMIRARVVTVEELSIPVIYDKEKPDRRISLIINNFQPLFVEKINDAINKETSKLIQKNILPSAFDANVETQWNLLETNKSKEADFFYSHAIRKAIFGIASERLSMELYKWHSTGPSEAKKFYGAVMERTGLEFEVVGGGELSEAETEDISFMKSAEALNRLRNGSISVHNPHRMDETPSLELTNDSMLDRYVLPTNITINEDEFDPPANVNWRVITFSHSGEQHSYRIANDTLRHALFIHRPLRRGQGSNNVIDTILIRVASLDKFESLYEEYEDPFTHGDHVFRYPTIFWYMGGNYAEWLDAISSHGNSCVFVKTIVSGELSFDVEAAYRGNRQMNKSLLGHPEQPTRLVVLRTPLVHGYLVRILPGYDYTESWIDGPLQGIDRFPEEERPYLKFATDKIVAAILMTWSSF